MSDDLVTELRAIQELVDSRSYSADVIGRTIAVVIAADRLQSGTVAEIERLRAERDRYTKALTEPDRQWSKLFVSPTEPHQENNNE